MILNTDKVLINSGGLAKESEITLAVDQRVEGGSGDGVAAADLVQE